MKSYRFVTLKKKLSIKKKNDLFIVFYSDKRRRSFVDLKKKKLQTNVLCVMQPGMQSTTGFSRLNCTYIVHSIVLPPTHHRANIGAHFRLREMKKKGKNQFIF